MMEQSAEDTARAHARAAVDGDIGAMLQRMTPEALAKSMQVGDGSLVVTAYDLRSQARDGDDYLFEISFEGELGPLTLRERFRRIGDEWMLVDIERIA